MDFRFTEYQQDLIDAAKAFFDGEITSENLRALAGSDLHARARVHTHINQSFHELGLMQLMLPPEVNGLEQPLEVMAAISEAAAYSGLPGYFVHQAGIILPLLARIGDLAAVEAFLDSWHSLGLATPLRPHVAMPGHDVFLVTTEEGFVTSDISEMNLEPIKSIDPLRHIHRVSKTGEQNAVVDHHGAVLTAAQLIGLSQRMVDMSVEYAKDRHQFGKPIGSFQAIKHHLATVYTQIEFTRPMVHLAAIKGGRAVHTAKVAAIDTAILAAETAVQVHGGMGYTFEVDLHLFMKRAWALCAEWGDRNYHMKKLEDLILNGDADLGPGTTFT